MVRRDEGVVLPQRGSPKTLSQPPDSIHFHSGSLQPVSRGSSSKVSRVPTAISREEEREEEKEVKEEVFVVPDTLLLSISPDLVGGSPLSHHTIPLWSLLVFG